MTHTKLPFTYDKEYASIYDADGVILAKISLGQHSPIQKMVDAINTHVDLLEAAKDACLMLEEISNALKVISKKIPDIKDSERFLKIMDAIKKAEAK